MLYVGSRESGSGNRNGQPDRQYREGSQDRRVGSGSAGRLLRWMCDMRPLTTLDALDVALASASDHPILLFKHSETCGLSLQAHEEVQTLLGDPAWDVPVYLVSVQGARPVSNAIAERLGVRHASPQALLVCDGAVRWHTSHLAITASALQAAADRTVAAGAP